MVGKSCAMGVSARLGGIGVVVSVGVKVGVDVGSDVGEKVGTGEVFWVTLGDGVIVGWF